MQEIEASLKMKETASGGKRFYFETIKDAIQYATSVAQTNRFPTPFNSEDSDEVQFQKFGKFLRDYDSFFRADDTKDEWIVIKQKLTPSVVPTGWTLEIQERLAPSSAAAVAEPFTAAINSIFSGPPAPADQKAEAKEPPKEAPKEAPKVDAVTPQTVVTALTAPLAPTAPAPGPTPAPDRASLSKSAPPAPSASAVVAQAIGAMLSAPEKIAEAAAALVQAPPAPAPAPPPPKPTPRVSFIATEELPVHRMSMRQLRSLMDEEPIERPVRLAKIQPPPPAPPAKDSRPAIAAINKSVDKSVTELSALLGALLPRRASRASR